MNELLLDLMRHMRWADGLIADALARDAANSADATRLFAHIASVEHLWYSRIRERTPLHAVWPALSVAAARALAAEHAELFEQLIGAEQPLDRLVRYTNSAGRTYESSVRDIVTHVAMHGSHHRGQILQQLRAAGREPPYVDYIEFKRNAAGTRNA